MEIATPVKLALAWGLGVEIENEEKMIDAN